MVRFGINTFLVTPGLTDADLSCIEQLASYGAEVIELAIVEPSAVTAAKLNAALKSAGLPAPVLCGVFGEGRDVRGNASEVTGAIAYLDGLLDLALQVDAGVICGPMYSRGGRAQSYSAMERAQQQVQIAESLRPLCQRAERAGITLALEPLNRFETDCINTIEQAVALIDQVGSPALKIHIDTFHMNIEEADSHAAILAAAPHIGHVHASASHRGLLGQDQVDWAGVLSALQAIGYSGAIVIESFCKDAPALVEATASWRSLYASPEQLAVEGLKFLREHWARCEHAAQDRITVNG